MTSWREVIQPLSSLSTVFAYNRAGYAPSGAQDRSRTPARIVDELRRLLDKAGLEPPYILVGHSLGGVYMLDFAQRYPEEVAGLVLVETRHPMFNRMCESRDIVGCTLPAPLRLLLPEHVRQEYDGSHSHRPPATLGDKPLAVISRTPMRGSESKAWLALWEEMQLGLSELSTNSRRIVARDAGHDVHTREPERLLEAVEWVLNPPHGKQARLTEWVSGRVTEAQGF
jgi:pimeloyl-ACP methyl ester carboxylesterase